MRARLFSEATKLARIFSFSLALLPLGSAYAQQSVEELAKAAQNPIADMISLPFQNNTNFNVGPRNQTQNILNIQPVIPLTLNKDWNVITRTIVPVISQPDFGVPGADRENGIGDIQFSAFFSPKQPTTSGWIWGVGPIIQMDSATNDALGQGRWSLGPTAVVLNVKKGSPWVYGALINNVWSIDNSSRSDVNQMILQPFVNYNFPKYPGLYLSSSPILTANWEIEDGEKWTVPLGGGIGKIFKLGNQSLNAQIQGYYNVVKQDAAGDWTLRLQLQLLFPK